MDVVVLNLNDRPTLLRNDTSGTNHWMTIRLVGGSTALTTSTKSNRDGIGARIRIDAGGRRQTAEMRGDGSYLSHNDLRAHFGLGDVGRVDTLEIRWPSGQVDTAKQVAVDRFYVAREGGGIAEETRSGGTVTESSRQTALEALTG
jgi:hypothetical protein